MALGEAFREFYLPGIPERWSALLEMGSAPPGDGFCSSWRWALLPALSFSLEKPHAFQNVSSLSNKLFL